MRFFESFKDRIMNKLLNSLIVIFLYVFTSIAAHAVGTESIKSSNPISGDEMAIEEGKTLYRANCAYCHGLRANGKGRGLPNSANLRKFKRGYTAFVSAVVNGYKRMPAWGGMGQLEYEQINAIGAYLETMAKKGANWEDEE